jgi:hypothetical protein
MTQIQLILPLIALNHDPSGSWSPLSLRSQAAAARAPGGCLRAHTHARIHTCRRARDAGPAGSGTWARNLEPRFQRGDPARGPGCVCVRRTSCGSVCWGSDWETRYFKPSRIKSQGSAGKRTAPLPSGARTRLSLLLFTWALKVQLILLLFRKLHLCTSTTLRSSVSCNKLSLGIRILI